MLADHGYTTLERLNSSARTLMLRALRASDQQRVILKAPASPHPSPSQISRFNFAFELQRRFNHAGIVKVLARTQKGSVPVMVLEDIGAVPLSDFLQHQPEGRLSLSTFLHVAHQISVAMGEIHRQHVIHKDLHPGNILVHPITMQVQITDFDLSSLLSREQPAVQPASALEGVLDYISPEQTGRMNRSIDYRTDFYSLGVLFYRMLTGRLPFTEDSPIAMVHAHIARLAEPINQLCPHIPALLSTLVDKLMAKNAEARYQSAAGLQYDLERCIEQWQHKNAIDFFLLGTRDLADRLQISQRLYGRESEIEQLLQAFGRTLKGRAQLLTVQGYSGIGKSSLIQEAHKPIAAHGGWFISGKFEQFQHHIPFSGIRDALKSWIQLVLADSQTNLEARKQSLLQALGNNARVLVDFEPEMELLLGSLPPSPELGPLETQNRFYQVMQQFFSCVTQELPLVLFLDDLQWADTGTLNLLRALMRRDAHKFLLIVAVRDNEVTATHPSMQTVAAICQELSEENCAHLTLAPLSPPELESLLRDTLRREEGITDLAALIHEKTAGNPFFINEFLRSLYSDGLLWVDTTRQQWDWSLERMHETAMTDNVIDLMITKMRRLPHDTQKLLQLAACIGARFDLNTLALIDGQPLASLQRRLWPALHDGLLLPENTEWGVSEDTLDETTTHNLPSIATQDIRYFFLHDRAQQAAYQSLDAKTRELTHLNIARMLQTHDATFDTHQNLFTIVGHFNQALPHVTDPTERLMLATLNAEAAQQAHRSSVWLAASRYIGTARELLPADAWHSCLELTTRIHVLGVECSFLVGQADNAESLAGIALQNLQDPHAKARICLYMLSGNMMRGKRDYALARGLEGLRYCGIEVPPPEQLDACSQQEQSKIDNDPRPLMERLQTTSATNATTTLAGELLSALLLASYLFGLRSLNTYLAVQGVQLILRHGLCDTNVSLLSQYIVVLLRQHKLDLAESIATHCIKYADNAVNKRYCVQVYLFTGVLAGTHAMSLRQGNDLLRKGYHVAMEYGDISGGIACFSNIVINRFAQGDALHDIALHIAQLQELMKRHQTAVSAGKQYARLINMLRDPEGPSLLDASAFAPMEWNIINSTTLLAFIEHLRLQWYFWSGRYDVALGQIGNAERSLDLIPGFAPNVDHVMLKALLQCFATDTENNADTARLTEYLNGVRIHFTEMAQRCPEMYEHKRLLVAAELSRLTGTSHETISLYRSAVTAARRHQFIQYEGLAHERLCHYLLSLGWDDFATVALKEALYLHGRWGCQVRQNHLLRLYPELASVHDTGLAKSQPPSPSARSLGEGQTTSWLDLESILKSNLAISSELKLDHLLSKMLHIMLENAGAQSASLLLKQNGQLALVAKVRSLSGHPVDADQVNVTIPITDSTWVPHELIRYALVTGKTLNIPNAPRSDAWSRDPYVIRHQPLSVLCLPLQHRDRINGVLYLENMLTTDAFTDQRVQVLQMLLTQAAISLENAQLFEEVQALNSSLEQKVEQRTAELNAANKELEAFSYSVSHDLRSPIRNINGFSKMLMEQYRDTLGNDGLDLLQRINRNTEKMAQLITGLLELSKVTRCDLVRTEIDLASMARNIGDDLINQFPQQKVTWTCIDHAPAHGDARLLYAVLENLLSNAWKYSSKIPHSVIEFGTCEQDGSQIYFVRDNGAGFDMRYVSKLFQSFQRLHHEREFPGTGIGLATVHRIIQRHGGKIWAEGVHNQGATFYFTLD